MRMHSSSADRPRRVQVRKRLIQALTAVITLSGVLSFAASVPALAATPKPAKLSLSPASFQYGPVAVGTSSASQSFAVTNTGQSASGPISVVVTGANAADFAIDANSCAATLVISSRVRPLNITTSCVQLPSEVLRVLAKPNLCRPFSPFFSDQ